MKFDKQEMFSLRSEGKSYQEIADILGCSIETVKYQLIPNRKKNGYKYHQKKKTADPLYFKKGRFMMKGTTIPFSLEELRQKIGDSPKCYLTGEPIDLLKPETYSLDHVIPLSRGGKSSLENCELIKADINQAKWNMTPEEFLLLCKRVINGTPCRT